MSLYVKNMNREFHNNKYLRAYEARGADRGRKNMEDRSHYKQQGDFLHDAHMEKREQIGKEKVGVGSTRDSKFKPGFFRRHAANIDHTSERVGEEKKKVDRFEKHYGKRLGNISKNDNRNGNILSHEHPKGNAPPYRPVRAAKEHSSGNLENENTKRQMRDPASRFHALITPEQRERHRVRRELITKGLNPASSDLGNGRRDFPSNGAADAFNMTTSNHQSRVSRYGRGQVQSSAMGTNFHVGEQGRSPTPQQRGKSPMLSPDRLNPPPRSSSRSQDRYSPQPQRGASPSTQNRIFG